MSWIYEQAGVDYGPEGVGLNPVPGYKVALSSNNSTVIAFTRAGVIEDPAQPGQFVIPAPPGLTLPQWAPLRMYWSRDGGTTYDRSEPIGPVELGDSGEYVPPAPPNAGSCVGSLLVLDKNQQVVDGVTINFQMLALPADQVGLSYNSTFSLVSAGGGRVDAAFPRGSSFRARRGNGQWVTFSVPTNVDNFTLPDTLGTE